MKSSTLLERLSRRGLFRIKPGLERVQRVLKVLGNPENKPRTIHIAGTNGKGSVAACLESVLRHAGYRTGLYTSPHLSDVRERVQIDRRPISHARFTKVAEHVLEAEKTAACTLTYFEFLTVVAFVEFAAQGVDVAVIETGMGGRWDATNVLACPALTIITSIGLDHVQWLGHSEAAIAKEKAGIIKEGIPVISGVRGQPAEVIARTARANAAPLLKMNHDFSAAAVSIDWVRGRQVIRYTGRRNSPETYTLGLLGDHQVENAAVALSGLEVLRQNGWVLKPAAIRAGLENVQWAGRFQIRRNLAACPVLFDGAHNPAGLQRLLETLKRSPWAASPKTFLMGVYRDKDHQRMMKLVQKDAKRLVLCTLPGNRALPARELLRSTRQAPVQIIQDPHKALQSAIKSTNPGGLIVVCGSITLVGMLLKQTEGKDLCLN